MLHLRLVVVLVVSLPLPCHHSVSSLAAKSRSRGEGNLFDAAENRMTEDDKCATFSSSSLQICLHCMQL